MAARAEPEPKSAFVAAVESAEHAGAPGRRVNARVGNLVKRLDVGQQVVGSDQWFSLGTPTIEDGFRGTAVVASSVEPIGSRASVAEEVFVIAPGAVAADLASAFVADNRPTSVSWSTSAPRELQVGFVPRAPGAVSAMLRQTFHWSDGAIGEHSVELAGTARRLTDPPPSMLEEASSPGARVDAADSGASYVAASASKASAADARSGFQGLQAAIERARDAAGALADAQNEGVRVAEEEARSFTEAVPKAAWWAELAEIAISMAVGAIAGSFAKRSALALGSLAGHDKDSLLVIGLADGIKDGLKTAVKQQVSHPDVAKPRGRAPTPGGSAPHVISTSPLIDFWAHQHTGLLRVKDANAVAIDKMKARVQPLLASSPQLAVEAIERIASSLSDVGTEEALDLQRFASEVQWASGIAQAGAGTERVAVPGGEPRAVTRMDLWRDANPFTSNDGILELDIELPADAHAVDPAAAVVAGASIRGLSQEIADQLWVRPLDRTPVPIVMVVRGGGRTARLTRDETGRVRVAGALPMPEKGADVPEANLIQDASSLFDGVLSRSLQAWGLPELKSNDAHGRGD